MRPRLLPKSEVDTRKAEEQRQSIQEGLKVAERVDTLRETLASEEMAFESYRTESLKKIQEEIQSKHQEKETLVSEVEILQRKKILLQEPLDAKWKEVDSAQRVCNEWEVELRGQKVAQDDKASELTTRELEARIKEEKAEDLKKLASAMFSQAEIFVSHAKEESADMRNKAHAELLLTEVRQVEITEKEKAIALKEKTIKEREQKIEKYEIDLAKREQTLRAGWKNLEQTKQKLL